MSELNSSNIYKIAVVMGSDSDLKTLKPAIDILNEFEIDNEVCILSAHRTPMEMMEYAKKAESENIKVIIAGAGGAAHLPGMIASLTCIPVIGVPVETKTLRGIDSLLSIVQMPAGIPVATVAINGGKNAGLLAIQILSLFDETLRVKMKKFRDNLHSQVRSKNRKLSDLGADNYLKTD
ncbi:5-(carboxyamino)imidazole ribonucleotide mutase [Prochlorococcus sp. AH-716-D22]|nr:5-(carboxyamino)imidazole ribonucleotide mutase [Prochlorococcus sp. AH-716-D22]